MVHIPSGRQLQAATSLPGAGRQRPRPFPCRRRSLGSTA